MARRSAVVRADPRRNAPVAFRLNRGDKVLALTGVVMTTEPGIAEFLEDATMTNHEPWEMPRSIRFNKGEQLFILRLDELDGQIAGWFKGQAFDYLELPLCQVDAVDGSCRAKLIKKPVTEWWAQVQRKDGGKGWTRDTDAFDPIDHY